MCLARWLKYFQRLLAEIKCLAALNALRGLSLGLPLMRLSMFGVAWVISKLAPR